MFDDRSEAGERLADLLEERNVEADIVLGIPRGGLPVARPVADRLDASLDIVTAKKLGLPGNPEFGIGAASSDGSVWINDEVVRTHDVSEEYIEKERERAAETAREKLREYRGDRSPPDLEGKTVVVVDDGVATGATARACLRQVQNADAERTILAVPVGPPDALTELEYDADEVIAVESPPHFGAVGAFYRDFEQVSDQEAREYLDWPAPAD